MILVDYNERYFSIGAFESLAYRCGGAGHSDENPLGGIMAYAAVLGRAVSQMGESLGWDVSSR